MPMPVTSTNREEYDKQHYEGASTHFGPWTLAAYRQSFSRLAESLADPVMNPWAGEPEPVPDDLSDDQVVYYNKPVVHDQAPVFKSIGQTVQDASSAYQKGDHVQVKFWSGHPRNDLKTMASFLKVFSDMRMDSGIPWPGIVIWKHAIHGSV